jgi:hypothetical protein
MPTKVVDIRPKQFQWDFFSSTRRFPGFLAGWGTGKTMWALHKGILLSKFYLDNLGVIVRSKYTDLRDSTMKDFTRYTGIHVPQGTKEAKVGSSTILFRHAKELSGLQNVNLGWFYIEQAEEFPSELQFTLLRGRLRRQLQHDESFAIDRMSPMYDTLCDMRDNPLRQGMVIANSNGHNWVWKMWVRETKENYPCVQATSFDNYENLPEDFIKDLKEMKEDSPEKYRQYVMNDHSEVDLEASYYARVISDLRRSKQITKVPHGPETRVFTAWDIGMDCTSIWFFQLCGREIHVIDYYENTGKPIQHYVEVLDQKKKDRKFIYGTCFMPHDANKREMQTGISLSKAVKVLGYPVRTFEREQNVDFGINRVMTTLPRCWFDEDHCDRGIEALEHYRREKNEETGTYTNKPLHDWASHPADSFRYLTKSLSSLRIGSITKDKWRELKKRYA